MSLIKKSFVVVLCAVLVSACSDGHLVTDKEVSRVTKTYEVIAIDHPKHFYVDLRDVETGQVHEHQYVSKHCNISHKLALGSQWQFTQVTYENSASQKFLRLEGVNQLCRMIEQG